MLYVIQVQLSRVHVSVFLFKLDVIQVQGMKQDPAFSILYGDDFSPLL